MTAQSRRKRGVRVLIPESFNDAHYLCSDPLEPGFPDSAFAGEAQAAIAAGWATALVDFESLTRENDPGRCVRRVPRQSSEMRGIYRGWMLKPIQYAALHTALADRGIRLINDPSEYRQCHWFPESYPLIESLTPNSVSMPISGDPRIDDILQNLQAFGDRRIIVKDYVKSCKHDWFDACFISSASDRSEVERVVRRFLELQGDDLNEGLVFREFVDFAPLATHPRSGMPLSREHRIFYLAGAPIFVTNYWSEGEYQGVTPPLDEFADIATKVRSHFFTMDVAQRTDGNWMIVELGDGQVSGLPANADLAEFYRALAERARSV